MSSLDQGAIGASPEVRLDAESRLAAEYRALRGGVGIAPLPDRIVVRVVGADRVTFMHGMCSQDVKGLAPGAVAPALLLTERAHLIADFLLYAEHDALLIEIEAAQWPAARVHLERLLVADDVEFEPLENLGVLDLEGPESHRVAAAITGTDAAAIAEWRHVRSGDLRLAHLPRFGAPAASIIAPREILADLTMRATADNSVTNIVIVSPATLEILRVENGRARLGGDATDKTIALEARLNYAISFNKGCYVGQETIERATARGGLKKRLFGLRIDGDRAPTAGAAITLGGKEIGHLTSIVRSPRFGLIGLAIIHQSAWTVGSAVAIHDASGEIPAAVSDLPFA